MLLIDSVSMCQKQVDTVPVRSRELKWHPCIVRVHPGACAGAWEQETHAECQKNDASSPECIKDKEQEGVWSIKYPSPVLYTVLCLNYDFFIFGLRCGNVIYQAWVMLLSRICLLELYLPDVLFWSINGLFSTLETHPLSLRLLKIASPSLVGLHYEL